MTVVIPPRDLQFYAAYKAVLDFGPGIWIDAPGWEWEHRN